MGNEFSEAIFKMLGALILVIGIFFCLLFLLKKIRLGTQSNREAPKMRLMGTLNIAPKRAIALVEVCNQWLVVGVGTESVTLLSKVDTSPEGSSAECSTQSEKSFQSLLRRKGLGIHQYTGEENGGHEDS